MSAQTAWKSGSLLPAAPVADPKIELESVSCLLCGGEKSETVVIASDPTTGLGGHFRAVRCENCRMVFTSPRPTTESIGLFYPEDYQPYVSREWDNGLAARLHRRLEKAVLAKHYGYPGSQADLKTSFLAVLGKWKIRRTRQRQSWIPFIPPGRLLDFGCGAGNFLEEMREFGWSVEGLDMSEAVGGQVEKRTGIKVHVGTLPHGDLTPESFDAVTMWNSLEHVHQPRETIRAAGELLRTGGILVVGVPNIASWGFRTFGQDWHGLELPRHLSHFTPDTLCDMLRREGFEVLSCSQVARVGWLRRSVRRALKNGRAAAWMKFLKWKPFALRAADRTERNGEADFIRVVAEKR